VATFDTLPRFRRDFGKLTDEQKARFQTILKTAFVPDLATGAFRPGLRIKRVRATREVWEMTWAPDGRATWQYGVEVRAGRPHVIWRRIGTHGIFDEP
jgi:hypothetical protein